VKTKSFHFHRIQVCVTSPGPSPSSYEFVLKRVSEILEYLAEPENGFEDARLLIKLLFPIRLLLEECRENYGEIAESESRLFQETWKTMVRLGSIQFERKEGTPNAEELIIAGTGPNYPEILR